MVVARFGKQNQSCFAPGHTKSLTWHSYRKRARRSKCHVSWSIDSAQTLHAWEVLLTYGMGEVH
eukprot:5594158-Amphidinium_carterae.2